MPDHLRDAPLSETQSLIGLTETYAAHNYHPLPVVLREGEGAWVTDVEGRRYLDCLAGYSALNFGHRHPDLVAAAHEQIDRLTLTSRAFYSEEMALFARDLAELTDKEMILPMNSGAEAVETAIKVSRRWGYQVKGVPENQASIIVMEGNFHGRTTTIVSFSTDEVARTGYAPYTPGFRMAKYGSCVAVEELIDDTTVAVLFEPIQGEGGVVLPPDGFLREIRELCNQREILMVADEIQSGLARTGRTFACDHEDVVPDIYILGKALGGGIVPLSAIAADRRILGVITPGSHGSTFGGNPFAVAVGRAVIELLRTGEMQERATMLGNRLREGLEPLVGKGLTEVRVRGLWAGLDVDPMLMSGREMCMALLERGLLAKDTHGSTIRLAPPIIATEDDIDLMISSITAVLEEHATA